MFCTLAYIATCTISVYVDVILFLIYEHRYKIDDVMSAIVLLFALTIVYCPYTGAEP